MVVGFLRRGSISELYCRSFAVFGTECGGEATRVVRVNLRVVSRARDSDISKAAVDETSRAVRVDVDENAPGRQPLSAVRRNGIAMIEGTEFFRIEGDGAAILAVHVHRDFVAAELCDRAQLAPDDAKLLVGRGELEAVTGCKIALSRFEDVDAAKP